MNPTPPTFGLQPGPFRRLAAETARPAAAIMAAALLAAIVANAFRDAPLAWDWRPGGSIAEAAFIDDPAELERLMALPGAVLADARDPRLHRLERLPGSLSWPAEEAGARIGEYLAGVPPEALIVAYCQESLCPLAERLALALMERGRSDVRVFRPGVDGWRLSGRPVAGPLGDPAPPGRDPAAGAAAPARP